MFTIHVALCSHNIIGVSNFEALPGLKFPFDLENNIARRYFKTSVTPCLIISCAGNFNGLSPRFSPFRVVTCPVITQQLRNKLLESSR